MSIFFWLKMSTGGTYKWLVVQPFFRVLLDFKKIEEGPTWTASRTRDVVISLTQNLK